MTRSSGAVTRTAGPSMVGAVFWGMVALCLLTALVSATVVGALYLFGRTVLSGWLELR